MSLSDVDHPTRWKKGQSGNPSGLPGRPLGSRQAFSQGFTKDLAEVWALKGKETMLHTAATQPSVFFATCARLLPNDVRVTIEQSASLEPADIEILRAIRAAIPRADSMSPQQVLQHVLDAVRSYESPVVLALPKPSS
jgi:hypothetical protein